MDSGKCLSLLKQVWQVIWWWEITTTTTPCIHTRVWYIVSVNMGAPCMQEKSHMREKEFDNHAIVALLKEKMCTVGTFSSEAQKVLHSVWCTEPVPTTSWATKSNLQKLSLIYVLYPTFASLFKTIESVTLAAFHHKRFSLLQNHNWSAYGTTCMTDSLCWALQTYTCNEILWTAYWELMMIVNTVFVSSVQTAMASEAIT